MGGVAVTPWATGSPVPTLAIGNKCGAPASLAERAVAAARWDVLDLAHAVRGVGEEGHSQHDQAGDPAAEMREGGMRLMP
jgi:hypothetical protein